MQTRKQKEPGHLGDGPYFSLRIPGCDRLQRAQPNIKALILSGLGVSTCALTSLVENLLNPSSERIGNACVFRLGEAFQKACSVTG